MSSTSDNQPLKFNLVKQNYTFNKAVILTGNGNLDLSMRIASYFPGSLSGTRPNRFSDGEIYISQIKENCRQRDCIIIQSCGWHSEYSINDLIMEIFIMIDAVKRANARTITVVLPIFPYQRQDRKSCSRGPISASMLAGILEGQGINRLICFELHAGQIQGFFHSVPVDNLSLDMYYQECFNQILIKNDLTLNDVVIVSPDEGGVKRASRLAKNINTGMAMLYKERSKPNEIGNMVLMGDIKNKTCVIVDDMIDTAGTAMTACKVLKANGAHKVYIMVAHGVLSGPALDRIYKSTDCAGIYVSNTIDILGKINNYKSNNYIKDTDNNILKDKIKVFDVSEYCAAAIYKSLVGESVSALFDI